MRRIAPAGFTLLEVTIAAAILMMIMGVAIAALVTGQRMSREGLMRGVAQQTVNEALAVMVPELRQSGSSLRGSGITVTANADGVASAKISFKISNGISASAVTWSAVTISYEWRANATVNGKTVVNGIVRIGPDTPTGSTTRTDLVGRAAKNVGGSVIGGIDQPAQLFQMNTLGDQIIITLQSSRDLGDGNTVVHAVTETVLLRN